jgi:hypothetical protein
VHWVAHAFVAEHLLGKRRLNTLLLLGDQTHDIDAEVLGPVLREFLVG